MPSQQIDKHIFDIRKILMHLFQAKKNIQLVHINKNR